jgi:type II secretory pathway component GspD/PulD (secretin)
VLLQALSQKTNVRIIQQPRIFTADNQEAAFFDGQQIPFITDSVINSGQVGGVTQSFDYKDVGVLLNVRPRITVQRDVDMEVKLSLSAVVPGQTLFGGAILDLRQTTTKIIVKNGQTIVLSGLLKDVDSKITRSFPLLGDLPIIGELFKSRENTKSSTELIAFITPIVVDNPSENDTNFNQGEREALLNKALPVNSGQIKSEQQRIREQLLAPKSPTGEPMPELLPKPPSSGHYPPYDQQPPAHPQPKGKPQSQPVTNKPSDEDADADQPPDEAPIDIDDLTEEPSQ